MHPVAIFASLPLLSVIAFFGNAELVMADPVAAAAASESVKVAISLPVSLFHGQQAPAVSTPTNHSQSTPPVCTPRGPPKGNRYHYEAIVSKARLFSRRYGEEVKVCSINCFPCLSICAQVVAARSQ